MPAHVPPPSAPLTEIDTPALLLRRPRLERNIAKMADRFRDAPVRLRPHFKSNKCIHIARLQVAAGAVGITCAKLGEAEVLADGGITDILIANQIVGPIKIARLIELRRRAYSRAGVVEEFRGQRRQFEEVWYGAVPASDAVVRDWLRRMEGGA